MGEDSSSMMAAYVAEFVGTFMLVFTVCCNVLSATSADWAPTSIACVLMVAIYAFGAVSGAHLNPAVSLAVGLSDTWVLGYKEASWSKLFGYMGVQVAGGLVAAFAASNLLFEGKGVSLGPKPGHDLWEVVLVEAFYTAVLCFVVLNVAASKRNNPPGNGNQFFGLAIGFVIVAGGHAVGNISGACFNPAVSIGLDFSSFGDGVTYCLTYVMSQAIGSVVAVMLFRGVRPEDTMYMSSDQVAQFAPSLSTRLMSEFLGTYVLIFTVGMNVLGKSTATPWSAAAALMCMIYALGNVSGAHFNPAVTVAVVLSGRNKCSLPDGLAYIAIQVLAGLLAALLYSGVYGGQTIGLAATAPYTLSSACIAEFMFTFVLALVVLATATVKPNFYFALAIGSCVTAGGFAIGGVSGGELNPAVTLGIGLSHLMNGGTLAACAAFTLVQVLAGASAAGVFYMTHPQEYLKA